MDQSAIKSFRLLGKFQKAVSQADDFDSALKEGLRLVLENTDADHAVIWYINKGDGMLHPYYWICPIDLTGRAYAPGDGMPGRVYSSSAPEVKAVYKDAPDEGIDADFEGINIVSVACVPFSNEHETMGCIQFIKSDDGEAFTPDEVEDCQMLTLMVEIALEDKTPPESDWHKGDIILSARDIKKEFVNGDIVTNVLKGVNLDVINGEFLVVLGESGCGKSTFLNIIAGMDKATSGAFSFMGKDMTNATQEELTKYRRENIGFIFQSYNLMPNLNAKQNLDLIAELVDDPMSTEEALELVGLAERKTNYPAQLSGGQQQRVSIARALVKKPKMIFADEPTAALDYATSIEVLSVLEKVVATGTTLVMVTHNEEITRMANRVVRMRSGKTYEVSVNHYPVKATELVW